MDSEDMYSDLRVASFSCYLESAEESFVRKLTGGLSVSSSTVISPEETPCLNNLEKSNKIEPEISIFGADKYFSSKTFHGSTSSIMCGHEKETCVGQYMPDQNFRPNSPSICSEVSSWNRQSLLLQGLHGNSCQKKYKSGIGMRCCPIFACEGTCLKKKANCINGSADQSQPGLKNVEQFSFPVLNSKIENLKVKKQVNEKIALQEDMFNSDASFCSAMIKKEDVAVNLERKLSMLTWDAIPKTRNLIPASIGSSSRFDDMDSDDSSDLFEIENISNTGYSVLSRQEPYAPSKAWNFVKASAADMSSIVSDNEKRNGNCIGDMISTYRTTKPKDSCTKKSGARRLLGCKSYKAVRVAENTGRISENAKGDNKYPSTRKGPSSLQPAGK